jgi:copper chaperone CopZ
MRIIFVILSILFSLNVFAAKTIRYNVPDMTCGHCAKTITTHLMKRRSIKKENIKFNIEKKHVDITFSDDKPLTAEDIKYILVEGGYTLEKIK